MPVQTVDEAVAWLEQQPEAMQQLMLGIVDIRQALLEVQACARTIVRAAGIDPAEIVTELQRMRSDAITSVEEAVTTAAQDAPTDTTQGG